MGCVSRSIWRGHSSSEDIANVECRRLGVGVRERSKSSGRKEVRRRDETGAQSKERVAGGFAKWRPRVAAGWPLVRTAVGGIEEVRRGLKPHQPGGRGLLVVVRRIEEVRRGLKPPVALEAGPAHRFAGSKRSGAG